MSTHAFSLKTPSPTLLLSVRVLVFAACLAPALALLYGWFAGSLGANPIEAVIQETGKWTLRLLLLTLAVTPLRRLTSLHWLLRLRRMLGLFVFFYASLHLAAYAWLDLYLDWRAIVSDVLDRPFVTVGFAAFVLLVPLAVTSNQTAIRRMGGRQWQNLHRSIYAIAILAVLHYWWLVKADYLSPLIHTLVLALLLGSRAWWREQERQRQLSNTPGSPGYKRKIIHIMPK